MMDERFKEHSRIAGVYAFMVAMFLLVVSSLLHISSADEPHIYAPYVMLAGCLGSIAVFIAGILGKKIPAMMKKFLVDWKPSLDSARRFRTVVFVIGISAISVVLDYLTVIYLFGIPWDTLSHVWYALFICVVLYALLYRPYNSMWNNQLWNKPDEFLIANFNKSAFYAWQAVLPFMIAACILMFIGTEQALKNTTYVLVAAMNVGGITYLVLMKKFKATEVSGEWMVENFRKMKFKPKQYILLWLLGLGTYTGWDYLMRTAIMDEEWTLADRAFGILLFWVIFSGSNYFIYYRKAKKKAVEEDEQVNA